MTAAPMRLWTLHKDSRTVTCDAQANPLGIELVVRVGGEIRRTQVARSPEFAAYVPRVGGPEVRPSVGYIAEARQHGGRCGSF